MRIDVVTLFPDMVTHAASYGVLAWASAWLAAHHPLAHWVAALNNNQGLYDARVYLEQAKREGIRVLLPCTQRSAVEFGEEAGAIRVGFNRVFGLEGRELESILADMRAKVAWAAA